MVNKQHGDGVFTKVIQLVVIITGIMIIVIIRGIMIIVIIFRKTKMLSALLLSTVVSHFTTPNSMTRSEGVNRNTRY